MRQKSELGKAATTRAQLRLKWQRLVEKLPASRRADFRRAGRIVATIAVVVCVWGLAGWLLPGPVSAVVIAGLFVLLYLAARWDFLDGWFDAAANPKSPEREGGEPSWREPVGPASRDGKAYNLNKEEFEGKLKAQVIGQDEAIEVLVRQVRGKLAGANPKPLVLLLPGPTGTGKTELAKATAKALGVKPERFDMGEYASEYTASNLFGSAKGYLGSEDGGALPNALRRARSAPICVLLFDEVEKANRSLWPMLLAFIDEGRAGDSKGTVVAPQNTIVLMTSNLAAEAVGDEPERAKEILRRTGYFPQEFLGRVNKVIPLRRLAERDNERLIQRLLGRLGSDYGIKVKLDRSAMDALVEKTREEAWTYGGRGILEKLTDLLTDDLLDLQESGFKEATLSASRTSGGFVVEGSLGRARA